MAIASAARPGNKGAQNHGARTQTPVRTTQRPATRAAHADEDLVFGDMTAVPDAGAGQPSQSGLYECRLVSHEKKVSKNGNKMIKVVGTVIGPDELGSTIYKNQSLTGKDGIRVFVKAMAKAFGATAADLANLNLAKFLKPGATFFVKFTDKGEEEVMDEATGEMKKIRKTDTEWITKARYESSINAAATAEGAEEFEEEAAAEEVEEDEGI